MKRKRKRKFGVIILVFALFISFYYIIPKIKPELAFSRTADVSNGWKLILVNRENRIPKGYADSIILTTLSNGKKVDSRIYPALQKMFDDARADELELFVREGYRTHEEQQDIFDEKVEAYENEGYSKGKATKLTKEWVAVPGTSEHEIGIAVDINADTSVCTGNEVYDWLNKNAYKYGFIKRYPLDKVSITGVANEPWHYRYVGKKAAKEMHRKGLCLEEYLKQ